MYEKEILLRNVKLNSYMSFVFVYFSSFVCIYILNMAKDKLFVRKYMNFNLKINKIQIKICLN